MTNITAKEIAEKIFYSPATNGKAEESIRQGEEMIKEYARIKCEEQREICAEPELLNIVDVQEEQWIKDNLIINAPEPNFD